MSNDFTESSDEDVFDAASIDTAPIDTAPIEREAMIPVSLIGQRLDAAVHRMWPEFSRGRLQKWIKSGALKVNGACAQNKTLVRSGERVTLLAEWVPEQNWSPQSAMLDIRFEDDELLIVNKPAGLVVHPAPGHRDHTLVNALLYHAPQLAYLPRAGIIHRLDKETTGLLVVAKTLTAHAALVEAMQARRIKREYVALVWGAVTGSATVNKPIGRHPRVRTKMAVVDSGKIAVTHFQIRQRFAQHTLLDVQLETGRTHQIRVHLASIGLPIVGDTVYGGRQRVMAGASESVRAEVAAFRRQALHAAKLSLTHPQTGEIVSIEAPIPSDLQGLIALLPV